MWYAAFLAAILDRIALPAAEMSPLLLAFGGGAARQVRRNQPPLLAHHLLLQPLELRRLFLQLGVALSRVRTPLLLLLLQRLAQTAQRLTLVAQLL